MLENVKEMWTEVPKAGKGKKKTKPVGQMDVMCAVILDVLLWLCISLMSGVGVCTLCMLRSLAMPLFDSV